MKIFWDTIADYNQTTWVAQLFIILIGMLLTGMLYRSNKTWIKTAMKGYLAFTYLWIAFVYYLYFGEARSYHLVMTIFWSLMALVWIWDAAKEYTTFERDRQLDWLAWILLVMPFIYPAVSLARGMEFPQITSPLMPCSVTIFTIGLLLLFSKKINLFIVLCLTHWSIIGVAKTYSYNIPADSLLAVSAVSALYIFFLEYFRHTLQQPSKPDAKYIRALLILLFTIMGISLTGTFVWGVVNHAFTL